MARVGAAGENKAGRGDRSASRTGVGDEGGYGSNSRQGREGGGYNENTTRGGCPYGKKADGSCATKEERDNWNNLRNQTGLSGQALADYLNGGGGGGESGGSGEPSSGSGTPTATPAPDTTLDDAIAAAKIGLGKEFKNYGIDLSLNGRGDAQRFGWEGSSYNDQIDRFLANKRGSIAPDDTQGGQYFADTQALFADLKNQIESDTRGRLRRDLDPFAGTIARNQKFGDDYGKDITQGIYDQQFGDASNALQRGLDRGTMTQGAYDRALSDLGASGADATGRLDTYRRGQLVDTRQQYDGYANKGYDATKGFKLGGTFDTAGYQSQLDNQFQSLQGSFEGDLKNKIGNEKFFDWNTLIGNANANQPAENSKYNAPLWLKAKEETDANNDQFRGLGSTGGF